MTDLRGLGEKIPFPQDYSPGLLETVPADEKEYKNLTVTLVCPEYTHLCPKTGQPDFGQITISYVPSNLLVESKSLKLYLGSFRNHGTFHETAIVEIGKSLVNLLKPLQLRVVGEFRPRGGISISGVWEYLDPRLQRGSPTKTTDHSDRFITPRTHHG